MSSTPCALPVRSPGGTLAKSPIPSAVSARFPFATVALKDEAVSLEAKPAGWSPFVPGDADASSLPVGAVEYTFRNPTGIEYQVASHLISFGRVEEGLQIVRACRDRYEGAIRNPFSEIECGHWYARAMASYALFQALTGALRRRRPSAPSAPAN